MNKYFAVFAACSLVGMPLARAQAPAPVTVSASSGGTLTARNAGTSTVTAFVLTYNLPFPAGATGAAGAQGWQLYDAATEPLAAKPIPAGQEVLVRCHFDCAAMPFQLKAVIYQGGASWGDSGWAQRILQRRVYMQQAVTQSLSDLASAALRGATRSELTSLFESSLNTEIASAAGPDQRNCVSSVRGLVLRNLQSVLQTADGTPLPIDAVVQHEIVALHGRLAAASAYGGIQ